MVGVAQVDFREDLGFVEPIEHLRYEGERVAIFDCDLVEPPKVHDQPQLAIGPLNEHDRGSCRRLGRPDEAICEVRFHTSVTCVPSAKSILYQIWPLPSRP